MTGSLKDQTVLIVGRGSGIARAIAIAAVEAGAHVIVAGRDPEALSAAYSDEPSVSAEAVDLTDEASMAALAARLGSVDHAVSTASGATVFFAAPGITPATTYDLAWDGKRYPPQAVLGTACEFATGQRLASGDLEGGRSGAVRVLGQLGFDVRPRRG